MKLNPDWVAGFVDGEGTFYVGINKNPTMSSGYQVLPEFRVVQHKRDYKLLHALKNFFGAGVVRVNHQDRYELRIRSLEHLEKLVIPVFEKHQLMTQKQFDFIKFKKILSLMKNKEHLTKDGVIKIIDIASQMNRAEKPIAQKAKQDILEQDKVHA